MGTSNPAKIDQINGALSATNVRVKGIGKSQRLPSVEEDGESVVENARKKAVEYAKYLNATVMSMDNGLFFASLDSASQPATHVRRIPGSNLRPTDEQMLSYYVKLVRSLGDKVKAHWEFALCIANSRGEYRETVIKSPRIFVSVPSRHMVTGYPLESIQIDPVSGKYIADMSETEQAQFWQQTIGQPLTKFIVLALRDARFG